MNRRAVLGIVAAMALPIAFAWASNESEPALFAAQSLGVDIKIAPAPNREGAYHCTASIADLNTGEVLSQPTVMFRSGENAKLRTGTIVGGQSAEIEITVAASGTQRSAEVRVELIRAERRVTVQNLNVRL